MSPIDLMTAVVMETGVPLEAIKSKRRHRPVADARKCMAWVLMQYTRMPLWQAAELMGQRLSTIHWQAKSADFLMNSNPQFKRTMNRIINRLEPKAE